MQRKTLAPHWPSLLVEAKDERGMLTATASEELSELLVMMLE